MASGVLPMRQGGSKIKSDESKVVVGMHRDHILVRLLKESSTWMMMMMIIMTWYQYLREACRAWRRRFACYAEGLTIT